MPQRGMDPQRGGWYDVVDRHVEPGQRVRFAVHDRKAWWQQEQGILAYLILAGCVGAPDYLKRARESSAFYNAFFLDHDAGAVYFNVFASGMPYLLGTERDKGSHSMSGYHSFELCYLAAVYTNLLITKQPLDLHFKPRPGAFKDNLLRVAPDLLPPGSIRIDAVTVNGQPYAAFDGAALTVTIPPSTEPVAITVRIAPTTGLAHFTSKVDVTSATPTLTLEGELDGRALPFFRTALEEIVAAAPRRLVVDCSRLTVMAAAAGRALIFAKQRMDISDQITIVGANDAVKQLLEQDEFADSVEIDETVGA
jgi:anti-anti-sigma factor